VLKIQEWGERTKNLIRLLGKTMNENPKCHLQIPQPKKGIYGCVHCLMVHFGRHNIHKNYNFFFMNDPYGYDFNFKDFF
jgi:hypothetical protein